MDFEQRETTTNQSNILLNSVHIECVCFFPFAWNIVITHDTDKTRNRPKWEQTRRSVCANEIERALKQLLLQQLFDPQINSNIDLYVHFFFPLHGHQIIFEARRLVCACVG